MPPARVDLATSDGVMDTYLFQPSSGSGPWPAVIVYMDAFGVRPDLAAMAQRLADAGYVVALPNLYYRAPFEPFDAQRMAAGDEAEKARFKAQIASIDNTMVMRDTEVLLADLWARADVRQERAGAVGYCMGGGFAMSALGRFPDRVVVAASFHGGSLAVDKVDSPHLLASSMRGRLYIGVAGIDPGFTKEQQDRLEAALEAAGVDYALEVYDGARHGFAVTGHLVYDHEASERHWRTLLRLFEETLA